MTTQFTTEEIDRILSRLPPLTECDATDMNVALRCIDMKNQRQSVSNRKGRGLIRYPRSTVLQVQNMRRLGHTYEEISQALGIPRGSLGSMIQRRL